MAFDPLTGAALGPVAARSTEAIKVNNSLRRAIRSAISTLTLMNPDPAKRLAAAGEAFRTPDPEQLEAIAAALAGRERRRQSRQALDAGAGGGARSAPTPTARRRWRRSASSPTHGGGDALTALTPLQSAEEPEIAAAAKAAVAEIERSQAMWDQLQNVWFGLSLGSVLLLAAVGLAITFGVMGVINMAHGELIMLGAYTTFVTQELIRDARARPLRLVAGRSPRRSPSSSPAAIGVAIERGIVRFLYGRPLETLLATWGVSLILQQAVRTIFGPSNREVGNPSWMSGSFQLRRDAGHLEPLLHHHLRARWSSRGCCCCSSAPPSGCRCGR